jgi:3-oxoacyl-[acyl-carrier-protein] synthase III
VVTNDELAATMDTSDEWIRTRTGIRERRIGGSTVSLSVESGRQALEMAGLDPSRVDALVLSTTTPTSSGARRPRSSTSSDSAAARST